MTFSVYKNIDIPKKFKKNKNNKIIEFLIKNVPAPIMR